MLRNMVMFGAGLIIGGMAGIIIAGLMVAARKEDNVIQREKRKEERYKCKVNAIKECHDTCCMFCLGASECKYSCSGEPGECGHAIRIH